jgi:hypothetical protein
LTKRLRGLWIIPLAALAILSWERAYTGARNLVLGGGVTVHSLHSWWGVVAALCLLMFAITAGLVILFLRLTGRRIDRVLMIVCVENVLVIWLLLALAAITSDSAATGALAQVGLAGLGSWLWNLGLLWCLLLLYMIFKTIDAAPLKSE